MRIVLAKSDVWIETNVMIRRGQPWDADHPVVRAHPECFTDDDPTLLEHSFERPAVEEMTAVPGEVRRGPGRPRKNV